MAISVKRVAVYLPDPIYEALQEWANRENRPVSGLAAFLLETAIRNEERERKQVEVKQDGLGKQE